MHSSSENVQAAAPTSLPQSHHHQIHHVHRWSLAATTRRCTSRNRLQIGLSNSLKISAFCCNRVSGHFGVLSSAGPGSTPSNPVSRPEPPRPLPGCGHGSPERGAGRACADSPSAPGCRRTGVFLVPPDLRVWRELRGGSPGCCCGSSAGSRCGWRTNPLSPPLLRSKGAFKALPPKANS